MMKQRELLKKIEKKYINNIWEMIKNEYKTNSINMHNNNSNWGNSVCMCIHYHGQTNKVTRKTIKPNK